MRVFFLLLLAGLALALAACADDNNGQGNVRIACAGLATDGSCTSGGTASSFATESNGGTIDLRSTLKESVVVLEETAGAVASVQVLTAYDVVCGPAYTGMEYSVYAVVERTVPALGTDTSSTGANCPEAPSGTVRLMSYAYPGGTFSGVTAARAVWSPDAYAGVQLDAWITTFTQP